MTAKNESFVGTGRLHIDGRHVGNATVSTVTHTNEDIDLQDFQTPAGGLYNRVTRVTERGLDINLSDYSQENLKLALLGTSAEEISSSISDESITSATPEDRLIRTASLIDTAQAVTVTSDPAGTTYTEGTDYTVSAAGITPIAGGGMAAATDFLVSYESLNTYTVSAGTAAQREYVVTLDGQDAGQEGAAFVFSANRVKFPTAEELALLSEEFASLSVPGVILAASGEVPFTITKTQPT